jgi:hypothetical protein
MRSLRNSRRRKSTLIVQWSLCLRKSRFGKHPDAEANNSIECDIVKAADGRLQLTVTLPDAAALDSLARAVAVLLGAGGGGPALAETLQFPVPPAPGAERVVSPMRAIGAGAGRN